MEEFFRRKALDNFQFVSPPLMPYPDLLCDQVRLVYSGSDKPAAVAFRMVGLNFTTSWSVVGEGATAELVPAFHREGTKLDPAASTDPDIRKLVAALPPWLELWFIAVGGQRGEFSASLAGFLEAPTSKATASTKRRAVAMPLPNLYDNCCLCLGAQDLERICATGPNLLPRAVCCLEQWLRSSWNQDLFGGSKPASCRRLFKWDATTGNQKPATHLQWWDGCVASSLGTDQSRAFFHIREQELAIEKDGVK
jgi:hypothetical protein